MNVTPFRSSGCKKPNLFRMLCVAKVAVAMAIGSVVNKPVDQGHLDTNDLKKDYFSLGGVVGRWVVGR
jgi:hypothetical protein